MKKIVFWTVAAVLFVGGTPVKPPSGAPDKAIPQQTIKLPKPVLQSRTSVEEALHSRRSVREFQNTPLSLEELSQVLWAAQGVTHPSGFRTAPSAGARYPLETYVAVGRVQDLAVGFYRYEPKSHELVRLKDEDLRRKLAQAARGQTWVQEGAAVLLFSAVYDRVTSRYGERGKMYVHMEVGHAVENVYLQCESLHLGTVVIGAFEDDQVSSIAGLPLTERPLSLMPIGKKK